MNLTDEEIRIKVAEAHGTMRWSHALPTKCVGASVPNYPESLDACAEFEKTLLAEHPDLRRVYRRILIEVCEGVNDYWRATARQRCLAYLKVKGILP